MIKCKHKNEDGQCEYALRYYGPTAFRAEFYLCKFTQFEMENGYCPDFEYGGR